MALPPPPPFTRLDEPPSFGGREAAPLTLPEQWLELTDQLEAVLSEVRPGTVWRARLFQVHGRVRQLFQQRPDGSLYHLVYQAGTAVQKYSCQHALLSVLISEHAAAVLGWPQAWIDSLGRAALTMNVAMMGLQDRLAHSRLAMTDTVRAGIDGHAEAGARLLEAADFGDPMCVSVVRLHHDTDDAELPLAERPPEHQLARLLRRVDIFTAKISRRATRSPMSPVRAAREACLGVNGLPDEIGGALLKTVGLYPPGSFVDLASGELGIVVARGSHANLPCVAALTTPRGSPLGEPLLRDTANERYAVKGPVSPSQVKLRPPHDRVLALR